MNLPVQHLSDEAVAAFADGMLTTAAHNRAARHLADCRECAVAVDEQRAAVSLLRAAPGADRCRPGCSSGCARCR